MCTRLIISLFIFVLSFTSACANEEDEWNKGVIVLNTSETIWGDIKYNSKHDVVQCKTGNIIKAFSTYNVISFRFYDMGLEINRFYESVEELHNNRIKKKTFYEVVLEGKMKIYRKRKFFSSLVQYSNPEDFNVNTVDFDYYFLKDGELIEARKFKSHVIKKQMSDRLEEITGYMKAEKLISYYLRDQILIVDFYNSLIDPNYNAMVVVSN